MASAVARPSDWPPPPGVRIPAVAAVAAADDTGALYGTSPLATAGGVPPNLAARKKRALSCAKAEVVEVPPGRCVCEMEENGEGKGGGMGGRGSGAL